MAQGPEDTSFADRFRAEFPVFESLYYLNAGTDGPVARKAAVAAGSELQAELESGRSGEPHRQKLERTSSALRERVAYLLCASVEEVALTRSTTDGINTVISALELGPGDEVLTTDEEHPGLLAPLGSAKARRGFDVRVVGFSDIADEVTERTSLVCCSHVSWVSGAVVAADRLAASKAAVLLDGAQGLGAIATDVRALGCDFYAASGQKWLCGPDGSGYLYVARPWLARLLPPWPGYASLRDPKRSLELEAHPDARRFDTAPPLGPSAAWALAAFDILQDAGWPWLLRRSHELAQSLAEMLTAAGHEVVPRGDSTLVSWRHPRPEAAVEELFRAGIVVRHLPGLGLIRASVGAWSNLDELTRLVEALPA